MTDKSIIFPMLAMVGFFLLIYFLANSIGGADAKIAQADSEIIAGCQNQSNHECDQLMADFHNECNHAIWKPAHCKDERVDLYLRARGYL